MRAWPDGISCAGPDTRSGSGAPDVMKCTSSCLSARSRIAADLAEGRAEILLRAVTSTMRRFFAGTSTGNGASRRTTSSSASITVLPVTCTGPDRIPRAAAEFVAAPSVGAKCQRDRRPADPVHFLRERVVQIASAQARLDVAHGDAPARTPPAAVADRGGVASWISTTSGLFPREHLSSATAGARSSSGKGLAGRHDVEVDIGDDRIEHLVEICRCWAVASIAIVGPGRGLQRTNHRAI